MITINQLELFIDLISIYFVASFFGHLKIRCCLFERLTIKNQLHSTKNGKIYVSFAMMRLNGPIISDYLAKLPILRNFISKGFYIMSQIVHFVRQTVLENKLNYKSDFLKELELKFHSGHIIYSFVFKDRGGILIIDEATMKLDEVIASNEFGFLSHSFVHPKTNELLVGSFKNDFIAVIKP